MKPAVFRPVRMGLIARVQDGRLCIGSKLNSVLMKFACCKS